MDLELPRVFNELKSLVENYASTYDDSDILVEGVRPDVYVSAVLKAYQDEKEVQKVQKVGACLCCPSHHHHSPTL